MGGPRLGLWVSKSSDATTGGVADGIGGLGCGNGWKDAMMAGAGVRPWCKEKEKESGGFSAFLCYCLWI